MSLVYGSELPPAQQRISQKWTLSREQYVGGALAERGSKEVRTKLEQIWVYAGSLEVLEPILGLIEHLPAPRPASILNQFLSRHGLARIS